MLFEDMPAKRASGSLITQALSYSIDADFQCFSVVLTSGLAAAGSKVFMVV